MAAIKDLRCANVGRLGGAVEETHFTVTYSPVPDDAAPRGIGGCWRRSTRSPGRWWASGGWWRSAIRRARRLGQDGGGGAAAAGALAAHDRDLPFLLIYPVDADGRRATMAASSGVAAGEAISPRVVDLGELGADWPLAGVLEAESPRVVDDLAGRFGLVPPGPWSDRPGPAVVLPFPSTRGRRPIGADRHRESGG